MEKNGKGVKLVMASEKMTGKGGTSFPQWLRGEGEMGLCLGEVELRRV